MSFTQVELTCFSTDADISYYSSVSEVAEHITEVLRPVAAKFNLTLDAFGVNVTAGSMGRLAIKNAFQSALEPSPVTPTGSSEPFSILSGTIKAILENSDVHPSDGVVVAPMLGLGEDRIVTSQRKFLDDSPLYREHWYVISLN